MAGEPPPAARPARVTRGEALLLLGILALAAALRFVGLGWGLRHPPHSDERVFVENVAAMIRAGDLDHRYYEYPGLFFYLLYPVIRLVHEDPPAAASTLAARAMVASFGVLACALLHLWGRRLAGVRAGLLAALLLGVSPVAVHTAHMVRPDVVLQVFALLALLALARVGARARDDVAAGAALGLAGAVKFSGAFLIPTFVVHRWLTPGRRLRGLALAGGTALLVVVLATPYALLHAPEFVGGARTQVAYHYQERARGEEPYLHMLMTYAAIYPRAMGVPASLLAVVALVLLRKEWRSWLPLVLLPVTAVAVMASGQARADRHLLPSLVVPLLLAAVAADRLLRSRVAFLAVGGLLASLPLVNSVAYLRGITGSLTRDVVLDWAAANVPAGARVVASVPLLGLDTARWEVLELARLKQENKPQLQEADFVFATSLDAPAALEGLEPLFTAERETRAQGPVITVFGVPGNLRPPYRVLALDKDMLSASENATDVPLACDGREETWWRTEDVQAPGDFFQVTLREPARVARVRLDLGDNPKFAAKRLQLLFSQNGESFQETRVLPGRPAADDQVARGPRSQVLLLVPPVTARVIRLRQDAMGARRWGIAEIVVEALP